MSEYSENSIGAEIANEKRSAIERLERGLANDCADDIEEVLINLGDGTCDYIELIPVLQRISQHRSFYYFDDNGAGGFPHADFNRERDFRYSARKAIENIAENAHLESKNEIAKILKSNSASRIKNALEKLRMSGVCADESLIPILEKIARKNVYQSYSYYSGTQTEYELGELAYNVIQIIRRNIETETENARFKPLDQEFFQKAYQSLKILNKENEAAGVKSEKIETSEDFERCTFCEALSDHLTVNTGRNEEFPNAYYHLIKLDEGLREGLRRCLSCTSFFKWNDQSSWTGSGNDDSEELIRLPKRKSQLLDKLFSSDQKDYPTSVEVEEFVTDLSIESVVESLYLRVRAAPETVKPFLPFLMHSLQSENTSAGKFLNDYISEKPERAEELLEIFRSSDDWEHTSLTRILYQCLKVRDGQS